MGEETEEKVLVLPGFATFGPFQQVLACAPRARSATLAVHCESNQRGMLMPTTLEKSNPCLESDLPETVKNFVHENVQAMGKKELKAWRRESKKIMKEATRRAHADAPLVGQKTQQSAR
jgi:hypothetical protein